MSHGVIYASLRKLRYLFNLSLFHSYLNFISPLIHNFAFDNNNNNNNVLENHFLNFT